MDMKPTSARVSRRKFLKTAGQVAAVPYVINAAALGVAGSAPPSERITTALIGSGARGRQIIAGGDKVVAVCDVDSKNAAAAKLQIDTLSGSTDCAIYRDFREVLQRDDIDAVVVATPDHWHVSVAMAAVHAGKAVYCEKPLSHSIREGRILADAVARYGTILQVGSQQRSPEYEKFTRACEFVRNGRIGELQNVRVEIITRPGSDDPWTPRPAPPELDYEMWLGPAPWSPYHPNRVHYKFRFVSDFSGGDLTNWGAHHLDIAQWGIGASESGPTEVVGHGRRNASGIHDSFYDLNVDFKYENGVTLQLRSLEGTGSGGVRFEGTEGWIVVGRDGMSANPASLLNSRLGPDELRLAPADQAGSHMGIWLDCVRSRSPKGLNVPVEIGHRSATVCHLANIAMELERPLKWDPVAEQFIDDDQANRRTFRARREPWAL